MNQDPNSIAVLREGLDRLLAADSLSADDTGAWLQAFGPLEQLLAPLAELPTVPDTPGGRIVRALWFKRWPDRADVDGLLSLIADPHALVRLTAADALAATLAVSPRWAEPRFAAGARDALLQQFDRETSPVVGYRLTGILDGLPRSRSPVRRPRRRAPETLRNPYQAGLPVAKRENFFGRRDVLERIARALAPGSGVKSVTLYGARRSGKTSVLYQLRDGALGPDFLPVYIDMQQVAGSTQADFLRVIVHSTQLALRARRPELSETLAGMSDGPISPRALSQALEELVLSFRDGSLLILVDEYEILEQFLGDQNLAHQFEHLLQQVERFFVVFAGSRKIEALRNRNFEFLLGASMDLRISFLSPEDATALIIEPAAGSLKFGSAVVEEILRLTGGHPFYVQLLCYAIFELLKGTGTVELVQLDMVVQQFVENPAPHLILTWNGFSLEQRVVAAAAAPSDASRTPADVQWALREQRYPMSLRPGEIEQALVYLTQIDWMRRGPEGTFVFTMALVRRWIADSHSVAALAEEHRDRVVSQVASFWRQGLGWSIDLAVLVVLGVTTEFAGSAWWRVAFVAFVTAYFAVPLAFTRSTLGLRFVQLRVVDLAGRLLDPRPGIVYGLVMAVRLLLPLSAIVAVDPHPVWAIVAAVVWLPLETVDTLLKLFGKKRQGLYDKFMRTLLVPASAVKE